MNNKPYFGLWMLLAVALAVFVGVSLISPVKIFGVELQKATFVDALTASAQVPTAHKTAPSTVKKPRKHQRAALDTASKTILFVGDSMLEGLSPRLASYARLNGHKLYTVIWYSSTTVRRAADQRKPASSSQPLTSLPSRKYKLLVLTLLTNSSLLSFL